MFFKVLCVVSTVPCVAVYSGRESYRAGLWLLDCVIIVLLPLLPVKKGERVDVYVSQRNGNKNLRLCSSFLVFLLAACFNTRSLTQSFTHSLALLSSYFEGKNFCQEKEKNRNQSAGRALCVNSLPPLSPIEFPSFLLCYSVLQLF